MKDQFGRDITYLRVSVTDRCNLRCRYCTPGGGIPLLPKSEILSYEQISDFVRVAVQMGITKVRLTGGEPLVRRGLPYLVEMLSQIQGIRDLPLSTNGTLLADMADELAEAGLHRVNVSLDTMSPERYRHITRGGDIERVFAGIEGARTAGLEPVKLNCVVEENPDEPDARAVAAFAQAEGLQARFIRRMRPREGSFSVVKGGTGGDCAHCNRLRLSADGNIRPCLFSDESHSVHELGARRAIERAIANKPQRGGECEYNWIRRIGG
jgi:cyclic pyranopterin phosphate synthase